VFVCVFVCVRVNVYTNVYRMYLFVWCISVTIKSRLAFVFCVLRVFPFASVCFPFAYVETCKLRGAFAHSRRPSFKLLGVCMARVLSDAGHACWRSMFKRAEALLPIWWGCLARNARWGSGILALIRRAGDWELPGTVSLETALVETRLAEFFAGMAKNRSGMSKSSAILGSARRKEVAIFKTSIERERKV